MHGMHEPRQRGLGAVFVLGSVFALLALVVALEAQPPDLPRSPPAAGGVGPEGAPPAPPPHALEPQEEEHPFAPPPPRGARGDRKSEGRRYHERRLATEWLKKSAFERGVLARQYALSTTPTRGRSARSRFAPLFTTALRWASRKDHERWARSQRDERVKRFVELVDRYAQSIRDGRLSAGLTATLEKMQKSGLVSEREKIDLLATRDPHRRRIAYAVLRDTVFLRQMNKAGRIDRTTLEKIAGEQDEGTRRRAVDQLRRDAFWRVNAHLAYFMLKPAEQVKLRDTRLAGAFSGRLRRHEAHGGFRFLSVFPSDKPDPFASALRMTSQQEARINREGISPADRRTAALEIFREQRAAFAHVVTARLGADAVRRIVETDEPQRFYVRAFRVIRRFDPGQRRGMGPPGERRGPRDGPHDPRAGPGGGPPGGGPPGSGPRTGPGAGPRTGPGTGPRSGPRRGGDRGGNRASRSSAGRGRGGR